MGTENNNIHVSIELEGIPQIDRLEPPEEMTDVYYGEITITTNEYADLIRKEALLNLILTSAEVSSFFASDTVRLVRRMLGLPDPDAKQDNAQ